VHCEQVVFAGDSADRKLLSRRERGNRCPVDHATGSREVVMWLSSIPSFGACLRHGGVEGANRGDCPLGLSKRFAPMPLGTDTGRPADRF
jgi:hypothetical protein